MLTKAGFKEVESMRNALSTAGASNAFHPVGRIAFMTPTEGRQ